jgi:hypothetical protein
VIGKQLIKSQCWFTVFATDNEFEHRSIYPAFLSIFRSMPFLLSTPIAELDRATLFQSSLGWIPSFIATSL